MLLLLLALAGCAGVPEVPIYHAAATSPQQGATVRGQWSWATWRPFVTIIKIEGLRTDPWAPPNPTFLVDPGTRTLTVGGHKTGFLDPKDYLTGTVELKATLMAGRSYIVRFEIDEMLMTFWVEDEATHEMASEKCSTNATIPPVEGGDFWQGFYFFPMFRF
jgi:hypothetical protein